MKIILKALFVGWAICIAAQAQQITPPSDFLGYELGEQFTYHHRVVNYCEYLAETSPRMQLMPYGKTREGRELLTLAVSSPENLARLEEIRTHNLIKSGLMEGESEGLQLPVVYLSYNIHGNEAVCTESALATLYYLATLDSTNWLDELVVIIDPCVNPDGRERYVNWWRQVQGRKLNISSQAWEHREPWPGGRYNHYLFDMNRDWCWQTQSESKMRSAQYQQWYPQVHVDFHEMGYNSPYFFGPAADPVHEAISPWQRKFQEHAARNHARYFDAENWAYFTREIYDLFYPSYGDTWPTFQGAVGFTYEQGGSGRAGLGIALSSGDTLTLADRLAHHFTTSLSTIEISYQYRKELIERYNTYFKKGREEGYGPYKAYVVRKGNAPARIQALLALLDRNEIKYGVAQSSLNYQGFDFQRNLKTGVRVEKGDIVISTHQPKARLVSVLFEPKPNLEDSLTYDLTAWALPYAYNLETYAVGMDVPYSKEAPDFSPTPKASKESPVAYAIHWQDLQQARLLSELIQAGIKVRYAHEPFTAEGEDFDRGTLVVSKTDNPQADVFEQLQAWAAKLGISPVPLTTSYVEEGKDLGSASFALVKTPKVALLGGEGVTATAFGDLWYFLEEDLQFPVSVIGTDYLRKISLSAYNVLILPSGNYQAHVDKIRQFVQQGGKLIVMDQAIATFAKEPKEGAPTLLAKAVSQRAKAAAKAAAQRAQPQSGQFPTQPTYGVRKRSAISNQAPGSIYPLRLDQTHPLAYGEREVIYVLKRNAKVYPYLPRGGWNVGTYEATQPISGFIGSSLRKKIPQTMGLGVEFLGKGSIIYMVDSPIFRNFWHGGKLMMSNAIFFN
ncbi:MAG: M14 family metallopeptidase [Bacteroidota bacterium]